MTNAVQRSDFGHNDAQREEFRRQQDIWAQEIRRADERVQKFKEESDLHFREKKMLMDDLQKIQEKVEVRDHEIMRLHQMYQGG